MSKEKKSGLFGLGGSKEENEKTVSGDNIPEVTEIPKADGNTVKVVENKVAPEPVSPPKPKTATTEENIIDKVKTRDHTNQIV